MTTTMNENQNHYQGLTLEQSLNTMRQLQAAETLNHFQMGLLYIYVEDSTLLEGTKYKDTLDFFCQNIREMSRPSLARYGAVARGFSEKLCAQFGMTCLALLLTYKKMAGIELNHDEPGSTFILVPQKSGELKPKLFSDCTTEDLRKALAHLRSPTPGKPIPSEDRALYDGYLQAITRSFPKGSPVRVEMRSFEGKTVITFKDIPISEVNKLTEALLDQLVPMKQLPQLEQVQRLS